MGTAGSQLIAAAQDEPVGSVGAGLLGGFSSTWAILLPPKLTARNKPNG